MRTRLLHKRLKRTVLVHLATIVPVCCPPDTQNHKRRLTDKISFYAWLLNRSDINKGTLQIQQWAWHPFTRNEKNKTRVETLQRYNNSHDHTAAPLIQNYVYVRPAHLMARFLQAKNAFSPYMQRTLHNAPNPKAVFKHLHKQETVPFL